MARYRYELLGQLGAHCAYTPRARRLQQLERLRTLIPRIEDEKTYPYDYVLYQITRFHPDAAPHQVFRGKALRADLVALALDLSHSLDLPVAWAGEPVLTLQEVRRTYDVSLKTVRRWRARGLMALRLVFPSGRKLTCIRKSDLEAFVESHPKTFRRTDAYSLLSPETQRAVIARAYELSLGEEVTQEEAVGRLAREFACPHEAVRAVVREHDAAHPAAPIFAEAPAPLSEAERRQLVALYRTGHRPGELARQFLVGRSTVRRVVRELITEEVLGRPWRHVHCPQFDRPDAEQTLLADAPDPAADEGDVAEHLPVEDELRLFRQYNYLKYRLAQAREELSPSELSAEELDRLAQLHDRAVAVRNRLVLTNLRLVVHLASRHVGPNASLDDLVSDGTVSLMQAIERFDYTRGVRFSTYASWAILKNFAKSIPREAQARRPVTEDSQEIVEQARARGASAGEQRQLRELLRSLVASLLLELGPREREVLVARYGLEDQEAQTLEQIGRRYDITRERVRQIEARALRKLAAVADPELLGELVAPPPPPPH